MITTHARGLLAARGKVKTCLGTMAIRSPLTLAEQFAAAQDWWLEAGVDGQFADTPHGWLERPPETVEQAAPQAAVTVEPAEPALPPLAGAPSAWPQTLAEFAPWWLAAEQLETGGSGPRVAPRGAAGAELMVLVPMPEDVDREI